MCMINVSLPVYTLKAGPSEPRVGSEKGDGKDAPTHQAAVPKEEEFVLEKKIIDVSYFCHHTVSSVYACLHTLRNSHT